MSASYRHVHGPEFDSVDDRPAAMRCRWCGMILPDRRRRSHDRREQIEDGLITQLSRFAMRQEDADRVED